MNARQKYYSEEHQFRAERRVQEQLAQAQRERSQRIRTIRNAWKAHLVNRALDACRRDGIARLAWAVQFANKVGI